MGIQKDAEEVLVYLYNEKVAGNGMPQQEDFMKITQWGKDRVVFALEYLLGKNFIEGESISRGFKTDFVFVHNITPFGIDIIENEKEFEKHFNHKIKLGFYEYSWGAKEK